MMAVFLYFVIKTDLGQNILVGFDSFLRRRPDCRLTIGKERGVMPHTVIDINAPLT